jgi:hypothetical protein
VLRESPLVSSLGQSKRNYMGNEIGVASQREWHCALERGCGAEQVRY